MLEVENNSKTDATGNTYVCAGLHKTHNYPYYAIHA